MKKVITIFAIIFVTVMAVMVPVARELIFCWKRVDFNVSASEINSDVKSALGLKAKSSVLMEANSNKVLYEDNANKQLAPASMTKVMTMLIVMEEIDAGRLSLNDKTIISEYSASQEGSECFLDAGHSYTIGELIKSVAVASANDSCVALAEAVCGDEKLFVNKMNERAKALGMKNTNYANCTGLDASGHKSTAYDLCLAIKALSKYDIISNFEKTWMYDMKHKNGRVTGLTNTNRLVRNNPDCYMAKTGHTDDAGYCIVVYGKRGGTDMIACVMGLDDSATRFEEVTKLLNYGFANYESQLLIEKDKPMGEARVRGGKIKTVPYYPEEDIYGFTKKGEKLNPEIVQTLDSEVVKAPINEGDNIGKLEIFLDGEISNETGLEVRENVEPWGVKDIVVELIG